MIRQVLPEQTKSRRAIGNIPFVDAHRGKLGRPSRAVKNAESGRSAAEGNDAGPDQPRRAHGEIHDGGRALTRPDAEVHRRELVPDVALAVLGQHHDAAVAEEQRLQDQCDQDGGNRSPAEQQAHQADLQAEVANLADVMVSLTAEIGLNYIDTYHRSGAYPLPLPSGIGLEAAGVVEELGEGVSHLKVGDRIAYGAGPIGAYSEARNIPANRISKLPDNIEDQTAAAMMLKGMTVRYLLRETYKVQKGETILFHAVAGGVGLIAVQWAKHLGVRVIGTAGSPEKAELAKSFGCDEVIDYGKEDVAARVRELASRSERVTLHGAYAPDDLPRVLAGLDAVAAPSLWDEVYEPYGLKALAGGNTGMQMTGWFRKPIESVEDFKGLRMRIPGLAGKVYEKIGVSVKLLPGGEIFPALQRGVIDALLDWPTELGL